MNNNNLWITTCLRISFFCFLSSISCLFSLFFSSFSLFLSNFPTKFINWPIYSLSYVSFLCSHSLLIYHRSKLSPLKKVFLSFLDIFLKLLFEFISFTLIKLTEFKNVLHIIHPNSMPKHFGSAFRVLVCTQSLWNSIQISIEKSSQKIDTS